MSSMSDEDATDLFVETIKNYLDHNFDKVKDIETVVFKIDDTEYILDMILADYTNSDYKYFTVNGRLFGIYENTSRQDVLQNVFEEFLA